MEQKQSSWKKIKNIIPVIANRSIQVNIDPHGIKKPLGSNVKSKTNTKNVSNLKNQKNPSNEKSVTQK